MRDLLGRIPRILRGGHPGAVDETVEHSAGVKEIGQ
jgi:hypothetical protein